MRNLPILKDYVPLVRRALAANEDPCLAEVGKHGKIKLLDEELVTQSTLENLDLMIELHRRGNRPANAEVGTQKRDAMRPYLGKPLLKARIRMPGRYFEIHLDPIAETVVYSAEMPDAVKNASWVNMNLEWFETIEDDPAYHHWLESVAFPEFFDTTIFEASRTLYHVQLHDSLLEDAIYRGIEPARFQKADLNAAIRDVSSGVYGHNETKWFHVNVHDNLARTVEKFGRYSFDWPLAPIYILLRYHQAMEGGTTYAGLASAQREWVILFQDSLHISVHGGRQFVDRVAESLQQIRDA